MVVSACLSAFKDSLIKNAPNLFRLGVMCC